MSLWDLEKFNLLVAKKTPNTFFLSNPLFILVV
jgi:hypothetical protein